MNFVAEIEAPGPCSDGPGASLALLRMPSLVGFVACGLTGPRDYGQPVPLISEAGWAGRNKIRGASGGSSLPATDLSVARRFAV